MKMFKRALLSGAGVLVLALTTNTTVEAQSRIGIEDRFADVNGVTI